MPTKKSSLNRHAEQERAFRNFATNFDYDRYQGGIALEQNRRVASLIAQSLGDRVISPRVMLDLGAGTGLTIQAIREQPLGQSLKRIIAVDLSREMLEKLTAKESPVPISVVNEPAEDYLENSRDYFDLITSVGSFDFIPELPTYLALAADRLSLGGVLAATYLPRGCTETGSRAKYSRELASSYTEFFYTPEEIEASIAKRDIEVIGHHRLPAAYERGVKTINYNLIVAQRR